MEPPDRPPFEDPHPFPNHGGDDPILPPNGGFPLYEARMTTSIVAVIIRRWLLPFEARWTGKAATAIRQLDPLEPRPCLPFPPMIAHTF
jgi:hypothetical protein